MTYKIHPKARHRLAKIWADTSLKWGETQADKYVDRLYQAMQDLQEKPYLWRKLENKRFKGKEVYFQRVEKHFVFFKKLPSGDIGILSILHERMNLPERLLEDTREE
jgi:plasmid stabilization system protein ParE